MAYKITFKRSYTQEEICEQEITEEQYLILKRNEERDHNIITFSEEEEIADKVWNVLFGASEEDYTDELYNKAIVISSDIDFSSIEITDCKTVKE